jgi:phosphosulfolactate phosphohydrolase-like enzyme
MPVKMAAAEAEQATAKPAARVRQIRDTQAATVARRPPDMAAAGVVVHLLSAQMAHRRPGAMAAMVYLRQLQGQPCFARVVAVVPHIRVAQGA